MARPRKTGMDYFPHDTDSFSDDKIEALRSMFGNEGYAFYFFLLERIYRTEEFELDLSGPKIIYILAGKFRVSPEKFNEMLEAAIEIGCFDEKAYRERSVLTSRGIKNRAACVVEKRARMQERYRAKEIEAETVEPGISEAKTPQSKGEENKQKEIKAEESKENSAASGADILEYFSEKSGVLFPDGRDMELAQKLASEMPVYIVKMGIDEAFKRYKPKRQGENIKTLRYCEGPIRDIWEIERLKGGFFNGHNTFCNRENNGTAKRDWSAFLYPGEGTGHLS